tara:strand:- start:1336 stop:1605 length:270 start_codon:yes stop_codon:yes gene_type:complete
MITYDIKEGQLVRLFHGRPDMAWDIEQLTQEKQMNQLTKLLDADIKEIAQYVEEWLWYELEEEGHTFYTQDNMIYKALQAYKGGANERT